MFEANKSSQTAQPDASPVYAELERIGSNLEDLKRTIDALSSRLDPLLTPAVPEANGTSTLKEVPQSAHVGQLGEINTSIYQAERRLNNMLMRLTL